VVASWQFAFTATKRLNHFKWNRMLYDAGTAVNTRHGKHAALKRSLSYLEEFEDNDRAGRLWPSWCQPHRHYIIRPVRHT
jgi:hypothetical protein